MKKKLLIVGCSLLTLSATAQVDFKKGLILYLPFEGNTLDSSGYGNDAINYGATLVPDQWGRSKSAYSFNGISNYMAIANNASLQPNDQVTMSARIKVDGFSNGVCYGNTIISKSSGFSYGEYTMLFSPSNKPDCAGQDTGHQNFYGGISSARPSFPILDNPPYIKTNEWNCLIYSYDGANASMYVNGILRHKYATTDKIGTNGSDVLLGHLAGASDPAWFHGVMDEVRIYNRGLNVEEIDSLCKLTRLTNNTGINEYTVDRELYLAGNPVQQSMQLVLSPSQMGGCLIFLDMMGRELMRIPSLKETIVSVQDIPAGNYMLVYQDKNGTILRTRLTKQ